MQVSDLLHQDFNCGELRNVIEAVTEGINGKVFSHCAMVLKINNTLKVAEAIGDNVQVNSMHNFFARSGDISKINKVTVARVKYNIEPFIIKAAEFVNQQLAQPYDNKFLIENGKWYCNELFYQFFKETNYQNDFFELLPMTFKDSKTKTFFPAWVNYYKQLNTKILKGKQVLNPRQISRSNQIQIVNLIDYGKL